VPAPLAPGPHRHREHADGEPEHHVLPEEERQPLVLVDRAQAVAKTQAGQREVIQGESGEGGEGGAAHLVRAREAEPEQDRAQGEGSQGHQRRGEDAPAPFRGSALFLGRRLLRVQRVETGARGGLVERGRRHHGLRHGDGRVAIVERGQDTDVSSDEPLTLGDDRAQGLGPSHGIEGQRVQQRTPLIGRRDREAEERAQRGGDVHLPCRAADSGPYARPGQHERHVKDLFFRSAVAADADVAVVGRNHQRVAFEVEGRRESAAAGADDTPRRRRPIRARSRPPRAARP